MKNYIITWDTPERISNPYCSGSGDSIESPFVDDNKQHYKIVTELTDFLVELEKRKNVYKNVRFFIIDREVFPVLEVITKVRFDTPPGASA